jgi:hypothetical protein
MGNASGDWWSMRRHVMLVGSSSGGRHGRRLPLAVTTELVQPSDVVPATVVNTEVERLRRYLEVSQAMLEVTKREMQVIRDQ